MPVMPVQKPGRSKQDYGTPEDFIVAVKCMLGITEFDIDLAATAANTKASLFYSPEQDSLLQEWKLGDGWNWLNPPYANLGDWTCKAWREWESVGAKTVMLVPAGVGSNWWRDWVHLKARVLLLNGRLTFEGTPINPKTGKVDPYPKDCALLLYGRYPGYYIWDWKKGGLS